MFEEDYVYPLAMTTPNWEMFIKVSQDVLGFSPTRGLDREGIDAKSPCAFLGCLDFENQPKFNLSTGRVRNNTHAHVHVSFIVVGQEEWVIEIAQCTNLVISTKPNHKQCIILLTGNMVQWYEAVVCCARRIRSLHVRKTFNIIQKYIERTGFSGIWQQHKKLPLADGTYIVQ